MKKQVMLWLMLLALAGQAQAAPQIQTQYGPVTGFAKGDMQEFLGIPFAAPPMGALRWQPPQAPKPWIAPRTATKFGPVCAQIIGLPYFSFYSESEDCLYLNVYVPAKKSAAPRPVMVWIYGGGLKEGETNDYDGAGLARGGDVVVVTIAYRVNVFGFFAHPALDKEKHDLGNYGLMDQQFALKWIQRNIGAFGGDPGNVTIFGESAGGLAVLANMASPPARGLFHKAIAESGSYQYRQATLADGEALGVKFAIAEGCPDQSMACLRKLTPKQILAKQIDYFPSLMKEGKNLPRDIEDAFQSGQFALVPLLNGSNHDEYTFFQAIAERAAGKPIAAADYVKALGQAINPKIADKMAAQYPLSAFASPGAALAAAHSDQRFICPSGLVDGWVSKFAPVYAYEFDDREAPSYAPPASFKYNAYHTGEIQYLFPLYHGATGTINKLSPAQAKLSAQMIGYWTQFARSGNPNGAAAPPWPRYGAGASKFLSLRTPAPMPIAELGPEHHCAFWNAIYH